MVGAVYVYSVNNDTKTLELTSVLAPADLQPYSNFGQQIHFSDTRGLVTAYDWSHNTNCVYIFGRAIETGEFNETIVSWKLMQKVPSPSGAEQDFFGASLVLYKDEIAVIGAPGTKFVDCVLVSLNNTTSNA